MSVMTVASIASDLSSIPDMSTFALFTNKVRDCDGIRLNLGDQVVEAVMTVSGPNCPKMSAKPETFRVYMYGQDILESAHLGDLPDMHLAFTILGIQATLGDVSGFVLLRSEKSGKYMLSHSGELSWVGGFGDFDLKF